MTESEKEGSCGRAGPACADAARVQVVLDRLDGDLRVVRARARVRVRVSIRVRIRVRLGFELGPGQLQGAPLAEAA